MWPAVNGHLFLPTNATIIAAASFVGSGTTRIGRFAVNHSLMIPGLVATFGVMAFAMRSSQLF